MTAATVSGPSRMIASSMAMAHSRPRRSVKVVVGAGADEGRVQGPEAAPEGRDAGRRGRREGAAVVGLAAGDDLHLLHLALEEPVEARQLEGDLVGLGAAVGEEDGVHVAGS